MVYIPHRDEKGRLTLGVTARGQDISHNPLLNKGSAFTEEERRSLMLDGLLPSFVSNLSEQMLRAKENFEHKPDNIEKYIYLRSLQDRNETLFYALLRENIAEMLPIIYTPTVGEAVEKYGHIFRSPRGLFITPQNVDRMDQMAKNFPADEIEIIVATDNQGILGIGDQGVGGMSIPIGKLSIYTVGAGIHPAATLPVTLDVGTDNERLLNDPLYLGLRTRRLRGPAYDRFIKTFVEGVKRNFPRAILQWEDFSKQNAFTNLELYKEELPSFNDDIQGTGAVTLAGILCALRIKRETLSQQRVAILGAGAAGIGIARQILDAYMQEGLSEKDALDRIFVLDSRGLLTDDREALDEYKRPFARSHNDVAALFVGEGGQGMKGNADYMEMSGVIRAAKITVLIGVSAKPGCFDDAIVDLLLENTPEPIVFPLSNPTSHAEADPADILRRTNGRALVAAGSPFPPVDVAGRHFEIGQGNNAFIFPGVGLGAMLARAKRITPGFFTAAAHAVAQCVSAERLEHRTLYPPVEEIFEVSRRVALAVYAKALEEGTGTPVEGDVEKALEERMWIPEYPGYVAV